MFIDQVIKRLTKKADHSSGKKCQKVELLGNFNVPCILNSAIHRHSCQTPLQDDFAPKAPTSIKWSTNYDLIT